VSVIPDHPDFKNIKKNEFPPWYTAFRGTFGEECRRFQMLSTGEALFEGFDTQPLYRYVGDGTYGTYAYGDCDLYRIMLNAFKNATPKNKK
jgi:hypothetical protein